MKINIDLTAIIGIIGLIIMFPYPTVYSRVYLIRASIAFVLFCIVLIRIIAWYYKSTMRKKLNTTRSNKPKAIKNLE